MLELEVSNSSVPPIKKGQWRSVEGSPWLCTSGSLLWLRKSKWPWKFLSAASQLWHWWIKGGCSEGIVWGFRRILQPRVCLKMHGAVLTGATLPISRPYLKSSPEDSNLSNHHFWDLPTVKQKVTARGSSPQTRQRRGHSFSSRRTPSLCKWF